MKLTRVAVFAAGYIIGAKAGRERYAQIMGLVERGSRRLEEFSSHHPPGGPGEHSSRAEGGA